MIIFPLEQDHPSQQEREQQFCSSFQDAKNGAEIKAVDAYCWLHSTVHLDNSLLRKLNALPRVRSPCQVIN